MNMSNWQCPSCGGGFPAPAELGDRKVCPWCTNSIEHEPEPPEPLSISRTVANGDDDDSEKGLLALFR